MCVPKADEYENKKTWHPVSGASPDEQLTISSLAVVVKSRAVPSFPLWRFRSGHGGEPSNVFSALAWAAAAKMPVLHPRFQMGLLSRYKTANKAINCFDRYD